MIFDLLAPPQSPRGGGGGGGGAGTQKTVMLHVPFM